MTSIDGLFEPTFLPSWLPGETIFSLASRYHVLTCNSLARTTTEQLFGSQQAGSHHDFPAGIDHFERVTYGQLGTAIDIICNHSILAFYLPFHTSDNKKDFIAAMRGSLVKSLKYKLGLQRSGFRANHPLKACVQCMIEDSYQFGTAYWHLNHQLPGVWVCSKHHCYLQEANIKANGVGRFLWYLPCETQFSANIDNFKPIESNLIPLLAIAQLAEELINLPLWFEFEPNKLLNVYRYRLSEKNWITPFGSLRMQSFVPEFIKEYASLHQVSEFFALSSNYRELENQLGRLLRKSRSRSHPLRHLLIIHFLFGNWNTFFDCYQNFQPRINASERSPKNPRSTVHPDPKHVRLIDLLTNQRLSMRQVANELHIDFITASSWAAQAGISTKRRPKSLTEALRAKIISLLKAGLDKQTIAQQCCTSIQTVNRILRTEPLLYASWKTAYHERTKQAWRNQLQKFIDHHPHIKRKELSLQFRDGFTWLYHHDKDWLYQHLPPKCPVQKTNYSKIDWEERDRMFTLQISFVAEQLSKQYLGKKIPIWALFQALPTLKAKADQLDKLPQTRRLIHQICGRAKGNFN